MHEPFEPGCFYHIYNHANGRENLFRCDDNYFYFLRRYGEYIHQIAETHCYCLMPNHFHFLVKVKSEEELGVTKPFIGWKPLEGMDSFEGMGLSVISKKISLQFSHLFNGYTQAYNIMFGRKGSLFIPRFKHKKITSDDYLSRIIHYIHYNPVHHGFVQKVEDWPYSSYNTILSNIDTKLNWEAVLEWFGGREEFISFHQLAADSKLSNELE